MWLCLFFKLEKLPEIKPQLFHTFINVLQRSLLIHQTRAESVIWKMISELPLQKAFILNLHSIEPSLKFQSGIQVGSQTENP